MSVGAERGNKREWCWGRQELWSCEWVCGCVWEGWRGGEWAWMNEHTYRSHRHGTALTIVQRVDRVDHQLQQPVSEFGPGCGRILVDRYAATARTRWSRSAFRGRPRRHRTARLRGHRCFRRVGGIALRRRVRVESSRWEENGKVVSVLYGRKGSKRANSRTIHRFLCCANRGYGVWSVSAWVVSLVSFFFRLEWNVKFWFIFVSFCFFRKSLLI